MFISNTLGYSYPKSFLHIVFFVVVHILIAFVFDSESLYHWPSAFFFFSHVLFCIIYIITDSIRLFGSIISLQEPIQTCFFFFRCSSLSPSLSPVVYTL
ncbi:hypothetical protein C8Q75DRAFT_408248 [Abortiporus biennis]|nr:hypothetical protein C8Q75DRAFT_408248 [Abortiporus biennis]